MTTQDALLAAVLASPADDLPRLVYADWLEEHGQPERAEFIRVQCSPSSRTSDIARILGGTGTEWVTAGVGNPDDWSWSGGLMTCYDDPVEVATSVGVVLSYVRGFVSEVRCTLADWCGGECQAVGTHHGDRCSGGRVQSPNPQFTRDCPACSGTGRAPGIGPRLVREHPVERVRVTDMRVATVRPGEPDQGHAFVTRTPHLIPPEVRGQLVRFRTEEDATSTLSSALIAWAKDQPPHVSTTPVSADVTR